MSESPATDLRYVSFGGPARAEGLARPACRFPLPCAPAAPALPDDLAGWVLRQAEIDPAVYRPRVFTRRIPACLRALGVSSVPAARALLERRRDLVPIALSTLLIGVTEFFRDTQVFDGIRAVALPALAARRWPPRIWSAGCSSGAELYSLAILLDEAALFEGATLLGTDCREDAIAEARGSVYPLRAIASLPAGYAERYLEADGDGGDSLRPVGRLRAAATWKVSDLHRRIEPGPWDIVAWRNAAIYLEPAAAGRIYRRLVETIAPGGFLVVGKAERPPAECRLTQVGRCLYQKSGGRDGC